MIIFYLQLDNAIEFANSWALDPEMCQNPNPQDPCDRDSEVYQQAQELCYQLVAPNGPFRLCHDIVDPAHYHDACVYDLCATLPDDGLLLCDNLAQYAQACRDAGGSPENWRPEYPKCGKCLDFLKQDIFP